MTNGVVKNLAIIRSPVELLFKKERPATQDDERPTVLFCPFGKRLGLIFSGNLVQIAYKGEGFRTWG